jgi:2-succinyl-6-hydroxy-2,4-cyclohexadiene-1-carboxylate synthase
VNVFARVEWQPLSGPLAAIRLGAGPRVVFAHGFTQTARSWRLIAERIAPLGYECVIVDMPGHGGSSGVRADLRRAADLLCAVGQEATYVGYSMGGRITLHAALMYPHLVHSLVVVGANPGIVDEDERAERRAADDALAMRLVDIGVEAFLRDWVRQPLFAGQPVSDDDFGERMRNTADGLASSLRLAGTGTQVALWDRLHELDMPVLAIAGSLDRKFVSIGKQLAATLPHGAFAEVPNAGHSVVNQAPDELRGLIVDFLEHHRR